MWCARHKVAVGKRAPHGNFLILRTAKISRLQRWKAAVRRSGIDDAAILPDCHRLAEGHAWIQTFQEKSRLEFQMKLHFLPATLAGIAQILGFAPASLAAYATAWHPWWTSLWLQLAWLLRHDPQLTAGRVKHMLVKRLLKRGHVLK